MIQANELRIGNLLKCKLCGVNKTNIGLDIVEVLEIVKNNAFSSDITGGNNFYKRIPLSDCSPIPLTEEILLKCGFDKRIAFQETIFESSFTHYSIVLVNENYYFHCGDEDEHFNLKVEYLHDLQNLYFAFTNKELEVKL